MDISNQKTITAKKESIVSYYPLIILHKGLMHVQTLKPTKSTFYLNPQSFTVHNILILSNEYLVKLP